MKFKYDKVDLVWKFSISKDEICNKITLPSYLLLVGSSKSRNA